MNQDATRPHVLLLPGNMCDARLWQGGQNVIIQAIEAHGLVVHLVDFKNVNSMTSMAAHALDQTDGEVLPIGFSMGGIVALEIARLAPHRVRALGLIDTTSHADTRGLERLRQQRDVRNGKLERVVTQELKPTYLAPCNADNNELLKLLCDMAMGLGPDTFITQSEALRTRDDLTPILANLKMPVFFACGVHDTLCPPSLHREMGAQTPNAVVHIIDDAGHILPLEQPAILAGLLNRFLFSTLGTQP